MAKDSELLKELGATLRQTRERAGLTQGQLADRANISRPSYREIETGLAAARATTLINIARALGMEMMFIPQAMVPAVNSLLRPSEEADDRPAFVADADEEQQQ